MSIYNVQSFSSTFHNSGAENTCTMQTVLTSLNALLEKIQDRSIVHVHTTRLFIIYLIYISTIWRRNINPCQCMLIQPFADNGVIVQTNTLTMPNQGMSIDPFLGTHAYTKRSPGSISQTLKSQFLNKMLFSMQSQTF